MLRPVVPIRHAHPRPIVTASRRFLDSQAINDSLSRDPRGRHSGRRQRVLHGLIVTGHHLATQTAIKIHDDWSTQVCCHTADAARNRGQDVGAMITAKLQRLDRSIANVNSVVGHEYAWADYGQGAVAARGAL